MSITDRVCLAGLDAMVLHLHDSAFKPPTRSLASSTQSGFTSSSFKHRSKSVIDMLRKPLGEKTRTLVVDVPSLDHESRNNILAPSAPPSFVTKTSSSALHFIPHAGDGESRFQPLPAVLLQVDTQLLPNSHPLASLSMSERTGHARTRANPASSLNPGDYIIPALQHPNSPYMPWASSIRSQIMRPPTPTSDHSRPSSNYSRFMSSAGPHAPEPRRSSEQASVRPASKPGRIKSLRRSLKKSLGGLVRQLTTYTRRRPDIVIAADSVPVLSGRSFDTDDSRSLLTPPTQSVISISPSSDFVHLAEWLDERNRDAGADDGVMMSLDDYERRGSWLALVPDKDKCCGSACGRAWCDVHVSEQRARKPSMSLPALPAVQASAFLSPSSIPARPPTPHISLVPQS